MKRSPNTCTDPWAVVTHSWKHGEKPIRGLGSKALDDVDGDQLVERITGPEALFD